MNEAEWLTSKDLTTILSWVQDTNQFETHPAPYIDISERKLRLFACAFCRQVWNLLTDGRSRIAVEVAEKYADGLATEDERWEAEHDAFIAAPDGPELTVHDIVELALNTNVRSVVYRYASWVMTQVRPSVLASLRIDIMGNPFHPVNLPPCQSCGGNRMVDVPDGYVVPHQVDCSACAGTGHAWATPTVLALARNAYDKQGRVCDWCKGQGLTHFAAVTRSCVMCGENMARGSGRIEDGTLEPDRLLILRDALIEAGCDEAILLDHLAGLDPHVRGCFVLDLVLGKF